MAQTTWGELRDTIRRALLKDTVPDEETGELRWTDEELRDFCWFALDTFAVHTAVATATSFVCDGETDEFNLPENLYTGDKFETTSLVYTESGTTITYHDPVMYTDSMNLESGTGYRIAPGNVLRFTTAPTAADTLTVEHFAFYNHPYADSDTIDIPQWGIQAIAYLSAAHALSGDSMKSAKIRQYNQRADSGNPEDNPIKEIQSWWLEMYEREMSRYVPQDRSHFFREVDY